MHSDFIQEELLQEWLRAGDEQALFSLMLLYYNDLFKYALKCTADAELSKDLVNQFFIHVWDHKDKLQCAEKIKPYLVVSFKRYLLGWLRKQKKQRLTELVAELYEHSYEDYLISLQKEAEIKTALQLAIRSLPQRQKELVQLKFYEQLSYEEIAERTSLTIRTIYNRLHVAIKKLRSHKLLEQIRKY